MSANAYTTNWRVRPTTMTGMSASNSGCIGPLMASLRMPSVCVMTHSAMLLGVVGAATDGVRLAMACWPIQLRGGVSLTPACSQTILHRHVQPGPVADVVPPPVAVQQAECGSVRLRYSLAQSESAPAVQQFPWGWSSG